MTDADLLRKSRRKKLAQAVHLHLKLLIALAVGVALYLALYWGSLSTDISLMKPLLSAPAMVAWNGFVLVYLALAAWAIARHDQNHMRRLFSEEDEGAAIILALVVIVTAVSVAAIFKGLGAGARADRLSPVLAMITVVLSWVFIHTIFAFHYAHEFYGEAGGKKESGLLFPPADQTRAVLPDYWDFVYFSFVIGMTFQVSDVQITSKAIRRLALFHGVVSFFYNVAVLALAVSLGGEFIKG
jgi:uncharacterized membrane protein